MEQSIPWLQLYLAEHTAPLSACLCPWKWHQRSLSESLLINEVKPDNCIQVGQVISNLPGSQSCSLQLSGPTQRHPSREEAPDKEGSPRNRLLLTLVHLLKVSDEAGEGCSALLWWRDCYVTLSSTLAVLLRKEKQRLAAAGSATKAVFEAN